MSKPVHSFVVSSWNSNGGYGASVQTVIFPSASVGDHAVVESGLVMGSVGAGAVTTDVVVGVDGVVPTDAHVSGGKFPVPEGA